MAYSRKKLVEYIAVSINKGVPEKKLARQVAAYLIENGKTSELQSVMRDAQELRATRYGVVEFNVRSASTLDKSVEKRVEKIALEQYKGSKKVIINEETDESAIGGINILLPHHSLDLTIQSKLNRLKEGIV